MSCGIEPHPADFGHFGRRPAQKRVQARDQLVEGKGLDHVVVAAGAEAGQPVRKRVARGEKEDRRLDTARAKRLAHITAVGIGQPDVDHERIGNLFLDACEQIRSVCIGPDPEIFLL